MAKKQFKKSFGREVAEFLQKMDSEGGIVEYLNWGGVPEFIKGTKYESDFNNLMGSLQNVTAIIDDLQNEYSDDIEAYINSEEY